MLEEEIINISYDISHTENVGSRLITEVKQQ